MSELCDSGSIVVDIDTITVLLMRVRLVSTIKIKSVYPLQSFQRYFILTMWDVYILKFFTNHPHSRIVMVGAMPCCVIVEERDNMSA